MKKSFYDVIHSSRVGSKPKFHYDIPLKSEYHLQRTRYSEKKLWVDLYKFLNTHDASSHLVRLSSDTKAGIPDVWYSIETSQGVTVHGFWELKIGSKNRSGMMKVAFSQGQLKWHQSRSQKVSTALVYYEGRLYRLDSWHFTYRREDLPKIPSVKWPNPSWDYFERIILNPE